MSTLNFHAQRTKSTTHNILSLFCFRAFCKVQFVLVFVSAVRSLHRSQFCGAQRRPSSNKTHSSHRISKSKHASRTIFHIRRQALLNADRYRMFECTSSSLSNLSERPNIPLGGDVWGCKTTNARESRLSKLRFAKFVNNLTTGCSQARMTRCLSESGNSGLSVKRHCSISRCWRLVNKAKDSIFG
jgi:hypothetical protein